jgi:serine/threonine-protein kinase
VDLVISSGKMSVPDVTGETKAQARSDLKKAGVKVQMQPEPSEADPGTVPRTDPVGGTRVAQGSTVIVYISQEQVTPTTAPPTTPPETAAPTTAAPTPTPTDGG